MVAGHKLLGAAKQIVTECAVIDDHFSPTRGQGDPSITGPHKGAFDRKWACMKAETGQPRHTSAQHRRHTDHDAAAIHVTIDDAEGGSDAASAIVRIRHLALAVCELTDKHVRYVSGEFAEYK